MLRARRILAVVVLLYVAVLHHQHLCHGHKEHQTAV